MKPRNLLYIYDDGAALFVAVNKTAGVRPAVATCPLQQDEYVHIDVAGYPQIRNTRTGEPVSYHSREQFAADIGATLFKTRRGFDRALARAIDRYGNN